MHDASLLIVDDELQIRLLLTTILQQAGYSCHVAEHVEAAKEALLHNSFDLLLTDMNMPGTSGTELARYVKKRYPQTGVVMVTVIDDPEVAQEALEIGVYGYIVKPFTNNLVLITVANALRRQRLELQEQNNMRLLEAKIEERTRNLNIQLNLIQNLIDAIPIPVYYKGQDGRYLGCNLAFTTDVNRSREWLIGRTVMDVHSQEAAEILWKKDQQLLKDGGVQVYEQTLPSPDGPERIGIIHKATFHDIAGKIAGLIGIRFDITELKQTEQALRASEEKLHSIMDNLHIGVLMINPQMEILEMNRQLTCWFPQAHQATGRLCYQVFIDQDQNDSCENCPVKEMFRTGKTVEASLSRHTERGERIFKVIASPMTDDKGTVVAALKLAEDITDALAAERELRQAQKLEAVGQLAAGIAHEINTPMQYVGDNIRFLEDAFNDFIAIHDKHGELLAALSQGKAWEQLVGAIEASMNHTDLPFYVEEIPKTIRQSLEGVNRISNIVKAMREFSHPGTDEKTYVDINLALENTLTISRNEWKYVAEVETSLEQNLPRLLCLPGEMNQVFLNIIVNAAHAIGEHTDDGNSGKGIIRLETHARDGQMEIRISDTGGGIQPAVQHRIFDPFFTTKKIGKGTGQGLAIARNVLVDKHQGAIRFETKVGRGTTFIISLPINEASMNGFDTFTI